MLNQLCHEVTERLLADMQNGVLPWRRPWGNGKASSTPFVLPCNAKTGKPYQSINIMLLWFQARKSPYWATEKTWANMGATVLESEIPTQVFFYTITNRKPFMKVYQVYNLEQVKGCDHLRTQEVSTNFAPAEKLIGNTGAKIVANSNSAWYDISLDMIHCPPREEFSTDAGFYTTRLHELGHWTGHSSRLRRVFGTSRQSKDYAFEELIAELTACFTAASLKIPESLNEMPNHASYMSQWLKILGENDRAIFAAASAAQKATKYLLAFRGEHATI